MANPPNPQNQYSWLSPNSDRKHKGINRKDILVKIKTTLFQMPSRLALTFSNPIIQMDSPTHMLTARLSALGHIRDSRTPRVSVASAAAAEIIAYCLSLFCSITLVARLRNRE